MFIQRAGPCSAIFWDIAVFGRLPDCRSPWLPPQSVCPGESTGGLERHSVSSLRLSGWSRRGRSWLPACAIGRSLLPREAGGLTAIASITAGVRDSSVCSTAGRLCSCAGCPPTAFWQWPAGSCSDGWTGIAGPIILASLCCSQAWRSGSRFGRGRSEAGRPKAEPIRSDAS